MGATAPSRAPHEVYPDGGGAPPFTLIDVRSPSEVARGALPFAHALPILTDAERHEVGIRYARSGAEAAVALGYDLTAGELEARAARWRETAGGAPTAMICWRGGLRSALATRHAGLANAGPVAGGYKALRAHLMAGLARRMEGAQLFVLGGWTGSGKTEALQGLTQANLLALDLERRAAHRGSAFGAVQGGQPAQATFENAVAADVVLSGATAIVVEDESRFIGARTVPDALWRAMQRARVVWLEVPLAERAARVFEEYVAAPARRDGADAAHARLDAALARLERRYGGDRVARARAHLAAATSDFLDPDAHRPWIEPLLSGYYDPLYAHAFDAGGRTVVHRGDRASVAAFLVRAAEDERMGG